MLCIRYDFCTYYYTCSMFLYNVNYQLSLFMLKLLYLFTIITIINVFEIGQFVRK